MTLPKRSPSIIDKGWGHVDNDRIAAFEAQVLTRRCRRCDAEMTGTWIETDAWFAHHTATVCPK